MNPDRWLAGCLLTVALLGSGCAGPRAVVFHTATQVGIDVNALEGGQQAAHVGYQRIEGVAMPLAFAEEQKVVQEGKTVRTNRIWRVNTNAYPVLSLFHLESGSLLLPSLDATSRGGLGPLRIQQVFATGDAAVLASASGAAAEDFHALQSGIASDAASNTLKAWVGVPDSTTRAARRQQIADWIRGRQLQVRVHDFLYEPAHAAVRRIFVQEKGGAEAFQP